MYTLIYDPNNGLLYEIFMIHGVSSDFKPKDYILTFIELTNIGLTSGYALNET